MDHAEAIEVLERMRTNYPRGPQRRALGIAVTRLESYIRGMQRSSAARRADKAKARQQSRKWNATYRAKHGPRAPRVAAALARLVYAEGLSITGPRPNLSFMDHAGKLHREDERTAEEVIRDWTRAQSRNPVKP
jgi:hypothetical protein